MEIVFHFGSSVAQNSKTSVTSRIDGRGGKMYVPRAMYSLRISFWVVPAMAAAGSRPGFGGDDVQGEQVGAVALIVIEV